MPLIERLKAEGHDVELIFFHDVPNRDVRYYQAQADIVVDMLTFGWFGCQRARGADARQAGGLLPAPGVARAMRAGDARVRRRVAGRERHPGDRRGRAQDLVEHPEKRREFGERGRASR